MNKNISVFSLVRRINKTSCADWSKPVKCTMRDRPHHTFVVDSIDDRVDGLYLILGDKVESTEVKT